jgi:hypothetical protein
LDFLDDGVLKLRVALRMWRYFETPEYGDKYT